MIRYLILTAYLVASVAGAHNLVLCVEFDGDVNLESSPSGLTCEPDARPEESANPTEQMAPMTKHCGPCVDTPWVMSLASQRSELRSHDTTRLSDVAFPARVTPFFSSITARPVPSAHAPRDSGLLPLLRFAVLLI